ncbi:WXG100 family type VII secretion target [Streptomyces sp. NPDC019224]|uniref:WXG100 family type VII secretion target n=1 Tax=Streptomyces sp. NPDC019224 TaxID=3154484 RepID=UPI0033D8902F
MGTPNYVVTPAMVTAAKNSCRTTAEEINAQLSTLRTYVVNLEQVWQGIAQRTFDTYMAEYDVYAKMLNQALNEIADGLSSTHLNYSEAEATAMRNLQALENELPSARLD